MLFHHDGRDYQEAASEAAKHAKQKLEQEIQNGLVRATKVVEEIEKLSIEDTISPASKLHYKARRTKINEVFDEEGNRQDIERTYLVLDVPKAGEKLLHPSAVQQIAQKSRIPIPLPFFNKMMQEEPEETAHLLNTLYGKDRSKYMIRSVGEQVRGFLSNRYRRYDSRPIFESFLEVCKEVGAVPYFGHALDTKMSLKAIIPKVYEPIENEVLAYGVTISHSDFGHGPLEIRAFCDRLWCTNKAIMRENIRSVHLGRALEEDMEWSEKTYQLDTATMASKVKDMIKQALSPETIEAIHASIRKAHEERVDPKEIQAIIGQRVSKADLEKIHDKYISDDVELLPPMHTKWRLSNAISWFANQVKDGEKQLDLMKLAGAVLPAGKAA